MPGKPPGRVMDVFGQALWIGGAITRRGAGDETRVKAPVKAAPDAIDEIAAGKGVLDVGGFVQFFVVVDAEGIGGSLATPPVAPAPATCGG